MQPEYGCHEVGDGCLDVQPCVGCHVHDDAQLRLATKPQQRLNSRKPPVALRTNAARTQLTEEPVLTAGRVQEVARDTERRNSPRSTGRRQQQAAGAWSRDNR